MVGIGRKQGMGWTERERGGVERCCCSAKRNNSRHVTDSAVIGRTQAIYLSRQSPNAFASGDVGNRYASHRSDSERRLLWSDVDLMVACLRDRREYEAVRRLLGVDVGNGSIFIPDAQPRRRVASHGTCIG